jgi:hypothetical protein
MKSLYVLLLLTGQAAEEDANRDERLELMSSIAERYVISVRNDENTTAELIREPLLRWSNPIRRASDGSVFLWVSSGRPVAALCIYPAQGDLDHEWQSLSEQPLRARFERGPDWTPTDPGVRFAPVAEAPPVAKSAVLRLSQMRALARRFTASVHKAPNDQELRLLTQPVYRYPEKTPGVVDGAIFAFGQGTDPELLLLLEPRAAEASEPAWHFALAPMSGNYLECRYNGVSIAEIKPAWPGEVTDTYKTFIRRSPAGTSTTTTTGK